MNRREGYSEGVNNSEDGCPQTSKFYDEMAGSKYEEGYSSPLCLAEDEIVRRILCSHIQPQDRIVDIGCGSGLATRLLKHPQDQVFQFDISHQMSYLAKQNCPESNTVQADQHGIPLPDNWADAVVSLYGPFSYSLNPIKALNKYRRILKPGGDLIIMPYSFRARDNWFVGGFSTAVNNDIPKLWYKQPALEELFSLIFQDVRVRGINYDGNFANDTVDRMRDDPVGDINWVELVSRTDSVMQNYLPAEFARHIIVEARKSTNY